MKFLKFLPELLGIGTKALQGGQQSGPVGVITQALNGANDFFEASSRERIEEIRANADMVQSSNELAIEQTKHSSLFVSGYRPFLGWVAGIACFYHFVLYLMFSDLFLKLNYEIKNSDWTEIGALVSLSIGLGVIRSYEKKKGIARNSMEG